MLSKSYLSILLIFSIALICTTLACDGKESGKSTDPKFWEDAFNSDNGDWLPIHSEGSPEGSHKIDEGTLSIDAAGEGNHHEENHDQGKGSHDGGRRTGKRPDEASGRSFVFAHETGKLRARSNPNKRNWRGPR